MKSRLRIISKLSLPLFFLIVLAASASGQSVKRDGTLQFGSLEPLASKASKNTNISLDELQLKQVAPLFLENQSEAKIKEIVAGIKGIFLTKFEFKNDNEYSETDLAAIRKQLQSSNWSRMIEQRNRRDDGKTEIFTSKGVKGINGLVILSLEPKRLTVINITGAIDFNKLAQFGDDFKMLKPETKQ